jgi:signal transduction histidine kinase
VSDSTAAREKDFAETGVLRTVVVVVGIATVVFLFLTAGDIAADDPYLLPWWNPIAASLVFGVLPALALTARFLSRAVLRAALSAYAIGFALVVVTFVPAMVVTPMPIELSPWPLGITALGTVAAALVWRPSLTWSYLVFNIIAMAVVRDVASGDVSIDQALQDAFFSLSFSAIFTAIALVSVRNARAVDRAATAAQYAAARASSAAARLRERARLDALVHDEVMTTLFYATVGTPELDSAVARQARRALDQLQTLGGDIPSAPVPTEEFVNRLRSVSLAHSDVVEFILEGAPAGEVPDEMAAAFVEAAGEAVRNSLAYASTDASPQHVEVRLQLDADAIVTTISDEGRGFNVRSVPAHRLGIRVSIEGRLAVVPGCTATVESRPGNGTRVTLRWDRP